ncbi:MAG: DeoR/GlpR family DNA-binding transcription regulator [Bacillota bacterium]
MLSAERRQYILSLLEQQGKVHAGDLARELAVSEDTIRRDLRDLAEAGLIQRVHGGALPLSPNPPSYQERERIGGAEKAALGAAAAQLVRRGQILILDAGTTTLAVAQHLPESLEATVITNSPPIAVALASHPKVEVVLLGGRLMKEARATVGVTVVEELERVRADLCFLGVCSVHPTGIATWDREEAQVKRAMIASAAEVVALAPTDRVGTSAPFIVAPVRELTHLVVPERVPEGQLAPYREAGITILRA